MGALDTIAGAALGMATAGWEDRRQLKQQEKLMALEMQGSKDMARYNQDLAYEMWEKTNYQAQMDKMKAAGLNPSLMYAKGGGTGITTDIPGGKVTGGTAAGSKGEIGMGMQLGMQMKMQEAQIKVAESQANLNNTQAAKLGGVDTTKTEAETKNLGELTENLKLKNIFQGYENEMKRIDKEIKTDFQQDERLNLTNTYNKTHAEATKAMNEANVSTETMEKEIELLNQRWVEQNADIALKVSGTKLNDAERGKVAAAINEMKARVAQMLSDQNLKFQQLDLNERQTLVNEAAQKTYQQRTDFETGTMAEIRRGVTIVGDAAAQARGYKVKKSTTETWDESGGHKKTTTTSNH